MLSTIKAVFQGIANYFGYLNNKQMLDAGAASVVATSLQEQANDLKVADAARQTVRADLAHNPDSLPNDEFRRAD